MTLCDFFKDVPNLRGLALDEFFRTANSVDISEFFESADDEWLKKNQRHFLWQTALIEFQLRTDNDNGTAGIIDALTKKVLTESATFALEHVAQRFEWSVCCTCYRAAVATIVEESINRLLKHALFVADDDFGSFKLKKCP